MSEERVTEQISKPPAQGSEGSQMQVIPPFAERVVTDYSTLPAGYMDRIQQRVKDVAARRAARGQEERRES